MPDSSYNTYDKITSIDWNGRYFILTARDEITDSSFAYAYSSDGKTWTNTDFYPNLTTHNPYSIKFLGDTFIASGNIISSSLDASGNTVMQNCIIDIIDGQYPVSIPTNLTGNTIVYDIECDLEQPHRIIFPKTTALVLGNAIAYTIDQGITWSNVSSPFSNKANDAVWNGKIWVSVGEGTENTISTSLDGINWVGRGNYIFSSVCNGIDWSPEQTKFVAVGSGTNHIATSMDGIYWRGINTTLFPSGGGNDVKWNGRIWVAVGSSSSTGNTIAYSSDAISWTYSAVSFQTSGSRLYYDGTMWIAYGTDPSYNIATSSDGMNWVLSYVVGANEIMFTLPTGLFADPSLNIYPNFPYPLKDCGTISAINKYVHNHSDRGCVQIQPISLACGSGPNSLAYSIDGIQWIAINNSLFSHCNRAVWNGSIWVAVGQGTYWVATSQDGLNWSGQNSVLMTECYDIAWNGNVFVAVGIGSSLMATSVDGITWTSVSISSIFSVSIHAIEWTGTVWLAYGEGINTTAISSSFDASIWTPTPTPNLCAIDCYNFLNGGLVDSSASSYQGSDIPANAFDMLFSSTVTKWSSAGSNYDSSGNYIGTNVTGTGILGEWLQVNLNGPYSCSSYYVIFSIVDGSAIPQSWSLLGSSDGSSWNVLDTFHYGTSTPPNNDWKYPFICLPLDINPLQVANYYYYRIVFTSNFGADYVSVPELILFNSGEQQSTLHIRPVILKDLILHPTRILSVDGVVPNIYKITDLSCNLIRSGFVHGQYINNIMYGLTSEPSAIVFDGENHIVLSTNGEVSYISNAASNTNLNFDNSLNGVSISGVTGGISAACYNSKLILIGSSYGVLNANVPPVFHTNNLSSLFTTINSIASNSGYGFVVSSNRIYLREDERLSLITPKYYDSALSSDTSISFNVYTREP